jgi:hypothetical protein
MPLTRRTPSRIFRQTYSGATTPVVTGVWTKMPFNVESFDPNSVLSGGTFTCDRTGKYNLSGTLTVNGAPMTYWSVALYKNGALFSQGNTESGSTSDYPVITVQDTLDLVVGDTVEVWGIIIGTTPNFFGGYMSGFLVP